MHSFFWGNNKNHALFAVCNIVVETVPFRVLYIRFSVTNRFFTICLQKICRVPYFQVLSCYFGQVDVCRKGQKQ